MQVRSVEKSRHSLVASMIAEGMIEEALEKGYGGVEDVDDSVTMQTESRDPMGNWSSIDVTYIKRQRVTDIGDPDNRLKGVSVQISWEDSSGGGEIELRTYLAGEL